MKQFEFLKWGAVIILIYALISLLNKFGIIGTSKEAEQTEKLLDAPQFKPTFLDTIKQAIAKARNKTVKQLTATDIKMFMPSSNQMLQWKDSMIAAKGVFNDDETAIYTVFRSIKTQAQMYFFNEFFKTYMKKDLVSFCQDFMNEDEMSKIYVIIKNKPLI